MTGKTKIGLGSEEKEESESYVFLGNHCLYAVHWTKKDLVVKPIQMITKQRRGVITVQQQTQKMPRNLTSLLNSQSNYIANSASKAWSICFFSSRGSKQWSYSFWWWFKVRFWCILQAIIFYTVSFTNKSMCSYLGIGTFISLMFCKKLLAP